jgi:hypothetical protein
MVQASRAALALYCVQEPEHSELTKEEAGETPDRQHLFRLFVGWVPKLFTEQDLLPLFQKVSLQERRLIHGSMLVLEYAGTCVCGMQWVEERVKGVGFDRTAAA